MDLPPGLLIGPLNGIAWHAHEMLWGFIATIAVGFLMTAGTNWTGINPMKGLTLALACTLWLLARVGYLVQAESAFWIAVVAELAFFLASGAMLRAVVVSRNFRKLCGARFAGGPGWHRCPVPADRARR